MIRSSTIKLLAKVIPGKERCFIALLMVGFVGSGVLETIGVASIGPFLAVLVDKSILLD